MLISKFRKIADYIISIDNLINSKQQITQAEKQKNGLM